MTLTTTVKVEQKFSAQAKDCANKKASEKLWILIHKPELNVHPKMTGNRKKKQPPNEEAQWSLTMLRQRVEKSLPLLAQTLIFPEMQPQDKIRPSDLFNVNRLVFLNF